MTPTAQLRRNLAARLHVIRLDLFGEEEAGITSMAAALGIPAATWTNYESGVTLPAEVVLRLISLSGANSRWLLTGRGQRYSGPDPREQAFRRQS